MGEAEMDGQEEASSILYPHHYHPSSRLMLFRSSGEFAKFWALGFSVPGSPDVMAELPPHRS